MTYRLLVPIAAALILCACDGGGSSPLLSEPVRAGVDRQVAVSARLPEGKPPPAGYDAAIVPENPTPEAKIGSVVPAAGGQQAEKAREEKAIADIKQQWWREKAGESVPSASTASLPPAPQAPTIQ